MQGNDVLATAKQAVAGMGSLFGSASKKLDWIGSSIDKKAQEFLPKLAISPTGRGETGGKISENRSPEAATPESVGKTGKKPRQKASPQTPTSENSNWHWAEDESPPKKPTR